MMLYTRIAEDIPAGTELSIPDIMEKYGVSYTKTQSATRVLEKINAVDVVHRRKGSQTIFRVVPDAPVLVRNYESKVSAKRDTFKKKKNPFGRNKPCGQDVAEREFVSVHNRLFSVLAAKRREIKKNSGGWCE